MAGSKRNKMKKAFSPPQANPPPPVDDDEDLMNDLLAELDSRSEVVQAESASVINEMQCNKEAEILEKGSKQTAKSRFEARQARKAAAMSQGYTPDDPEADARLERAAKEEEVQIKRTCDELGVQIHEINPDGHCLFSAIADQLSLLNIVPPNEANFVIVRRAASGYIYTHPDDFLPFLPCASGEDGIGATDNTGLMSPQAFEQYCLTIRDTGAWGGEPEILALSRAFNVPIHVIQGGKPPVVVHNPMEASPHRSPVLISYHRRMYGLGEHYNSLRPKSGLTHVADKLHSMLA
ncbi:hypothetical protein SERLADRAFT_443947 [Serpula lacrymans var. lacrymans S7.9]|uniref:OTU domain-containing protein n=1 Tax=Serpula lacrymans var. lacrymans (strain S7.9) TaxID=578457 RepID=F8PE15_SERL9|nr:uncharacterized protein SERLADRAFT_443947 [Serpula lacrymans var. lacrymans S7.9]EGO18612.1 hypothetical protein SERLADRAFT_443947 [Serpula lacrymans var. lacrymans S7.9]